MRRARWLEQWRWLLLGSLLLAAKPAAAQQMDRVRCTIKTLASPAFHGRGYVAGGDQQTAAFLARQFKALGLRPLAPDYRQSFPLDVNTFPRRP